MKDIKNELQNIILRDGPIGSSSKLKQVQHSLEKMRTQAKELKNKSISKVKKKNA